MSRHSYTACYIHLIWGTKDRAPLVQTDKARHAIMDYLHQYLQNLEIVCIALHLNPDHIHLLIELPTNRTLEEIVKLLKGSCSHWINQNEIIPNRFAWAVGYAAFTVSESNLSRVAEYVNNQDQHHKKKSFSEEYEHFITRYNQQYKSIPNR